MTLKLLLGCTAFFLPYVLYVLFLRKMKPGTIDKKRMVFFAALSCLTFVFVYFGIRDNTLSQLIHNVRYPTIRFYSLYYAVLAAAFAGFPLFFYLVSRIQKTKTLRVLSFLALLVSTFSVASVLWAAATYPISHPKIVFFVLSSPVEGGVQTEQVMSALASIFLPTVSFILLFSLVARLAKGRNAGAFWRYATVVAGTALVFATVFFSIKTRIWEYPPLIAHNSAPPVHSQFYEKEFIPANLESLQFPQEKRNLILIFLESIESSFASTDDGGLMTSSLIPNLVSIAQKNISFSHNSKDIDIGGGVGWTAPTEPLPVSCQKWPAFLSTHSGSV